MSDFNNWATVVRPFVWTCVTLAIAWAIGRVLASIVVSKVRQWLPGQHLAVAACRRSVWSA